MALGVLVVLLTLAGPISRFLQGVESSADLGLSVPTEVAQPMSLKEVREEAERRAILRVFSQVDGNISKAAKLLGISRPTLYNLMREYRIED